MNKTNALIVFLLCAVSISLLGCKESQIGKYANKSDGSEYIVLNENQIFSLRESEIEINGIYEINDEELRLIFKFDGVEHAVIASIKNGIITDEQNKYWHKSIVIKPFFIALAASLLAMILMFYASKLPNKYLRSLFQLGGFYVGIAVIIPFTESASQVREVHGKYYVYILIVFAISYKIIKKIKSKQANKKNQADA